MYIIVVAACLLMPGTDLLPKHQECAVIPAPATEPYDSLKECEVKKSFVIKSAIKNSKNLTVTDSKCVDLDKLKAEADKSRNSSPPSSSPDENKNPVDPNLKPLTPEQKKQGVMSM